MGMGSAFAAGSGIVKPRSSYLDIVNQMNKGGRRGGGGAASPAGMIAKEKWEREQDANWKAENAERGENAGKLLTERQWKAQEAEKARQLEREKLGQTGDLERERMSEKSTQDFLNRADKTTMDEFKMENTRTQTGIDVNKDAREGEKHAIGIQQSKLGLKKDKMAMEQEERTLLHKDLMNNFVAGDATAMNQWFLKNAPRGEDGSQKIPYFDRDEKGYNVYWPGADGPVPMTEDELGRILQSMSPKYERPMSDKAAADVDATRAGAEEKRGKAKFYGEGGTGIMQQERLRQAQAKALVKDSEDEAGYPTLTYEDAYRSLEGGQFAGSAPTRKIVRRGQTADGKRVVMYDDGSVEEEPAEETTDEDLGL